MTWPGKPEVIAAFKADAEGALATAERAQSIAQNEATSDESKAEGKYDTRATEASYLARGQADRVIQLRAVVAWFDGFNASTPHDIVGLGSLVTLKSAHDQTLLVCPVGGAKLTIKNTVIRALSLAAPLGRAIAGLEEGDDCSVVVGAKRADYLVTRLR
jgi:transcription elongation GreA/GreB family factor